MTEPQETPRAAARRDAGVHEPRAALRRRAASEAPQAVGVHHGALRDRHD